MSGRLKGRTKDGRDYPSDTGQAQGLAEQPDYLSVRC